MISVDSRQFRKAAALAGECVERRNTIPVLEALRARANGRLELSGTDLDMTVDVAIPCDKAAPETQDFLIEDFRFVAKAVAAAGGGQVALSPGANGLPGALSIQAGALAIQIKPECQVEDWPLHCGTIADEQFAAHLSPHHLRQIGRVMAAVSTEETRYYLNGVYLHHVQDWTWRAVATDGHRLMIADLALPDATGVLPTIEGAKAWGDGIIIPRKAIRMAVAALGKCEDGVSFQAGGVPARNSIEGTAPARSGLPKVAFSGDVSGPGRTSIAYRLSTKCIDGTYPDYRKVIPAHQDISVTLSAAQMRQALEAVGRCGGTGTPAVKLIFDKQGVEVSSVFASRNIVATFRIPAEHDAPKDFSIGFNGNYLKDCLAALRGETVFLGMIDSAGPVMIRDPEDTEFAAVLMPMRV